MNIDAFWKRLCTDLDYHFFTGVPNDTLKDIFNTLNPDILHFVPAANDSTAVGIATGVVLGGYKSVVLCDLYTLLVAKIQIDNFVVKHKIPILFITSSINNIDAGIKTFNLTEDLSTLTQVDEYIIGEKLPAILII